MDNNLKNYVLKGMLSDLEEYIKGDKQDEIKNICHMMIKQIEEIDDKTDVSIKIKCQGSYDRGAHKGPCTNEAVKHYGPYSFCDYCDVRRSFLSNLGSEWLDRSNDNCKSGFADISGELCDRKAIFDGYCLHCLTYYDDQAIDGYVETKKPE